MKTKLPILICLLLLTTIAQSQNTICIPSGAPVNIDGIISNNEWLDADSLNLGTTNQTKVYYKHDSNHLLVAFVGKLQSSSRIPEILIDTDNDKSAIWQADDWWFHVSAQDCEYQGQYANYDSCGVVRPNWTAVQNMAAGPPTPPFNDTIEVEIPFATLNINLSATDTIGISFLVTNTFNSWLHWPLSANRNNPSSWGNAFLSCGVSSILDPGTSNPKYFNISPNPTDGMLKLTFKNKIPTGESMIHIYDFSGKKVIQKSMYELAALNFEMDLTGLPTGAYLINFIENDIVVDSKKLILN